MAECKNKGCTGHARKGQFFCYDCYTAWMHGGDEAELAELRAFKERVFDAVLPAFPGAAPKHVRRTEQALFDVIYGGHYVLSKLRKAWYASPDFKGQNVPKAGPGVRMARARCMVEWYTAQLDKANKPKPVVLETLRFTVDPYKRTNCSDCGTPCWDSPFKGCPAETMVAARERALAATSAEAKCGSQCWALLGFPCVPVKVCNHPATKHPSAKQADEAEPLRLKVAELEGRLQHAQKCLVGVVPGAFVKILATACLLAGVGFGFLLP